MGCKSHLYHFNNTQEEVIPKIIEQYETFGSPNILQVENVESVRTTITEKLYSKI
jgi:chorismate mutase